MKQKLCYNYIIDIDVATNTEQLKKAIGLGVFACEIDLDEISG
jgi:hypothetical protein